MRWHVMLLAVWLVCHILIPLSVGIAGFLVSAMLTSNLTIAVSSALVGLVVAWFVARQYALVAIGPEFHDPDRPVSLARVAKHVLRLFLSLLIIPGVVLLVGLTLEPYTPTSRIVAILSAIPAQLLINFYLAVSAQIWSRRVRRGRVFRSSQEIRREIAAYVRKEKPSPADYRFWAGMQVPKELMGTHSKLLGATGAGKTVCLRHIIQSLVEFTLPGSNRQLVVFDPKRELYSQILGMHPQVPVILFDGTDARGFAWDIAADITEPNHAKAVAGLLVPEEKTSQPYFARAARRILQCILRIVITHASHWNLQDVFMILDDQDLLERLLPANIKRKYFRPLDTLKNTLATLDTLTGRFDTLVACWAKAEAEGRTLSLLDFTTASTCAILVIPRRLDIADAVDPTIRLIFERLIHLWLARPDIRFLPPPAPARYARHP